MGTTSGVNGERGQPKTNNNINAVFTNKKDNSTLNQSDFMKLMVAQMQNQDFMNPMDDTQMVDQMVAFSNMQQMQEMASYSKSQYAMSLLGKTVTASRFTVSGDLDTTTGPVQRLSLVDDEYILYIGGKKYEMSEIMGIGNSTDSTISSVSPEAFPLIVDSANVKYDSAVVQWKTPTEDSLTAKGLKYSVYVSEKYIEDKEAGADKDGKTDVGKAEGAEDTEDDTKENDDKVIMKDVKFDSVETVETGTLVGTPNQEWKPDDDGLMSQMITGLKPDTTYYINIVVTDANGKKAVYKPVTIKTRKSMD